MQVTSEDKSNVNPAAQDTTDKPKRTRRRKIDAGQNTPSTIVSAPLATTSEQPKISIEQPPSQSIESDVSNAEQTPELFGAAIGMESVPQYTPITSVLGSGCGNILKAARESQGLSILEVSNQLRLGVKQIQAIEQDDFAKLPQPSIVRGFIRNYARLLKVDAFPVLEAYQKIVPANTPLPLSVKSNASPSVIDKPARQVKPGRLMNLVILLVLVAILAYFYINHVKPQVMKDAALPLDVANISEGTDQEIKLPAAAETVNDPAEEGSVTDIKTAQVDQVPDKPPVNTSSIGQDTTDTLSDITHIQKLDTPENIVVTTPTPAVDVPAESTTLKSIDTNKTHLMFTVAEDSWVRINDTAGKNVFSEVLKAGSERTIEVAKPIDITVGYAAATQLSIDNQPFDLNKATRGRVARIHLK